MIALNDLWAPSVPRRLHELSTMDQQSSEPIVHGPRRTHRLGNVMVVDLTAPQQNLVVQRGSVLPRASLIVTTAARLVMEHSKAGEKVEHVVVLGSTEDPLDHPDFREITENLKALRDKWYPRAKLCIFTNCRDLQSGQLRQTLSLYDKFFLDFEWGTAKTFSSVTGEKSTLLAELTKHLSTFNHLIVQAHFFRGDADNSSEAEVKNWIKKLHEVRPQEVHIFTEPRKIPGKATKAITKTRQKQILDAVAESGFAVALLTEEPLLV